MRELEEWQWEAAAEKLPDGREWYEGKNSRYCSVPVPQEAILIDTAMDWAAVRMPPRARFFVYRVVCARGGEYFIWRRDGVE